MERYWKERWFKAKLDLDAARARVQTLKPDPSSASGPDGRYAYARYSRAIVEETAALVEYSRILRIYTDLVVHGKSPDDHDEQIARAKE